MRTKNTLITIPALKNEPIAIRKQGYSVDNEAIRRGVCCLTAPVTGPNGTVIAAIGITAETTRST